MVDGLTGNIAKLVVVENRFTPIITSHSFQVVFIPVVKGCCVGLSP